eukprot:UN01015
MLKQHKQPKNKQTKKVVKKQPKKKIAKKSPSKIQTQMPRAISTAAKVAKVSNIFTPKTQTSTAVTFKSPFLQTKRFMGAGWGYSHYLPADEVETRILHCLSSLPHVNQEKLTPKAHFTHDLGLDSLNQVELIFLLEQEFEVQIDDKHAILIESVPEAVHYFSHTPYCV